MSTLIIQTGAAGDVVRTTSLLNALEGPVYWVTSEKNSCLLPEDMDGLTIWSIGEAKARISKINFQLVISLEEDEYCAQLAAGASTDQLTGVYQSGSGIAYSEDASSWFDMSRISRFGMGEANRLKKENRSSFQHHIFKMIGREFSGERYRIYQAKDRSTKPGLIGIEKRSGDRWPNKQWWGYEALEIELKNKGRKCHLFNQRENLSDYLDEIYECSHVVSGDTLAMHIALAYEKTCTTIFHCTSPDEIYDYGLMRKIVSPLLYRNFYSTVYDEEVIRSVSLNEVLSTIQLVD